MDFNQTLKKIYSLVVDGKITNLKYLFEESLKADVDRYLNQIIDGQTILLIAIKNNHYELVKYLIEKCHVDIEQTGSVCYDNDNIDGASPLWLASASGNLPIVQLLIHHGANVNSTTKTKSSPLRAACYDGNLKICKYLVQHGADVELTNRHGHTCLMIASFKGHLNVVKFLVEKCKANVNAQSIKGCTAIFDAAESNSVEIFKFLLDHNAKMTEDSYKITPLLTAALNSCESIVHLIINYEDKNGNPLCSEIEKIHALELMGSTLVDKKRDICNGIYYWKLGFKRRLENIKRILNSKNTDEIIEIYQKKIAKPNAAYNYMTEFNSLEELEQISANVDFIRLQSLLIRERILGESHSDTTYYIRFRGAVYADSSDFSMCIALWLYALDKQQKTLDPLSALTQSSLFSFAELFSYMMTSKPDLVSFEEIFAVFKRALFELKSAILILPTKKAGQNNFYMYNKLKLLQRIRGQLRDDCLDDEMMRGVVEDNVELDFMQFNQNLNSNEQLMKNMINTDNDSVNNCSQASSKPNDNHELKDDIESINFHRILIILQIFIGLLCTLKPQMTSDQLFRFKKAVYQLIKLNPKGNNQHSLLHQASLKDESCQLIKFPIFEMPTNEIIQLLLECGADPNQFDSTKNTPLDILIKNRPNNFSAIKLFLSNGAHIDTRNNEGDSSLDFFMNNSEILSENQIHPMKHLSLQCLCAQTISKNNLSYKDILPNQISDFVNIH